MRLLASDNAGALYGHPGPHRQTAVAKWQSQGTAGHPSITRWHARKHTLSSERHVDTSPYSTGIKVPNGGLPLLISGGISVWGVPEPCPTACKVVIFMTPSLPPSRTSNLRGTVYYGSG